LINSKHAFRECTCLNRSLSETDSGIRVFRNRDLPKAAAELSFCENKLFGTNLTLSNQAPQGEKGLQIE
jgi:hypothetical protein